MAYPAAVVSSTGPPPTNPTFGNDGNDATFTQQDVSAVGDASSTSILTYSDFSALLGTALQPVVLRILHAVTISVGVDDNASVTIQYSIDGGASWSAFTSHSSSSTTPHEHRITVPSVNPALLQIRSIAGAINVPPGSASVQHTLYAMEVEGGTLAVASMMGF